MSIKYHYNDNDKAIGSDLIGTYLYSAPETIEDNEYSKYSDIYSLGIILYEILNSYSTIMEKTIEINKMIQNGYSKNFLDTFENESRFISKLMYKSPHQRMLTDDILSIKLLFKDY